MFVINCPSWCIYDCWRQFYFKYDNLSCLNHIFVPVHKLIFFDIICDDAQVSRFIQDSSQTSLRLAAARSQDRNMVLNLAGLYSLRLAQHIFKKQVHSLCVDSRPGDRLQLIFLTAIAEGGP